MACGYAGYVMWHMGHSGSGPLGGSHARQLLIVAAMASLRPRPQDRIDELPAEKDAGGTDAPAPAVARAGVVGCIAGLGLAR